MSSSSAEVEKPWPSAEWQPKTPQGQTLVVQPSMDATPHDLKEDASIKQGNKIREKVAQSMNSETLLCPITDFLEDYGPVDVASDEIEACKQFLLEKEVLIAYSKGYRWKDYEKDPSAMAGGEVEIFNHIKTIVDAIFDYTSTTVRRRGNEYKFEIVPHNYSRSGIAGTIVEPEYTNGKLAVQFNIVPNKYSLRRDANDQKEVRRQAVGDAQHIMSDDLRRMFIFAISIEDTRMSVWYFSRSYSMKALSFDWVEEGIDKVIHVFLAFAYATPKELGVDPLIHKGPSNPTATPGTEAAAQDYIFEFPIAVGPQVNDSVPQVPKSKYYKMVQTLDDQRLYCISGRTTRIWKVIEVDSPDQANPVATKPVVLKEAWLDADEPTEADNMDSIFKAIEKLISDSKEAWGDDWMTRLMSEDKRFASFDQATKAQLQRLLSDENYKSLFLTKLHALKGDVSKPLSRAARKSPPGIDIFPPVIDKNCLGSRMCSTTVASRIESGKPVEGPEDGDNESIVKVTRHYASKQLSRFVYKEVCSQLFEVGTLGAFMDVILQATEALLILFCAGWVHRDVSSGNLLAFNDNGSWKIKLSDLEFSEQLSHARHRADPRTGTPFFMPHEIIAREYLLNWIREQRNPETGLAKQVDLLGDKTSPEYRRLSVFKQIQWGGRVTTVPDTVTSNIPQDNDIVRYNFQHDLESIWWIVVYFITACVPYRKSRDRAKLIFSHSLTLRSLRYQCFHLPFPSQVGNYLHPTIAEAFKMPMEQLRDYLVEQYIAREVFGQIDVHESYSMIHNDFAAIFRELLENKDEWKRIPISPSRALTGAISPPIVTLKRGRGDNDVPDANTNKKARSVAN